jgi:hypothetical protein
MPLTGLAVVPNGGIRFEIFQEMRPFYAPMFMNWQRERLAMSR